VGPRDRREERVRQEGEKRGEVRVRGKKERKREGRMVGTKDESMREIDVEAITRILCNVLASCSTRA
jgi:hypothetical protein